MGRYKTVDTDERGELIRVPTIPDPVMTDDNNPLCNFCVYHESRETGELLPDQTPHRCGMEAEVGGCGYRHIFIYRHELKEYRARAVMAKINDAMHGGI